MIGINVTIGGGGGRNNKKISDFEHLRLDGVPYIGNRVYISTGAKVIGGVVVGNDVIVGANAVVINDVPDGAVVGGYR